MSRWHVRLRFTWGRKPVNHTEHTFYPEANSESEAKKKALEEARARYPNEKFEGVVDIYPY